jgi:hypothetical protein
LSLFALALPTLLVAQRMPSGIGVLPNQKQVQVIVQNPSTQLPAAGVSSALVGAIAAWNAALPADLRLVQGSALALPAGEVVFYIRFDNDPSHFGTSGIDEIGDTRGIWDHNKNNAVVTIFLVDKAGSFSTNGAPNTHDLQLVLMHELGHALGAQHDGSDVPPIMAPGLEQNGKLIARTKQQLPALRRLTQADRDQLDIAMSKRKSRDIAGSYLGTLKVTEISPKDAKTAITVGREIPVRDGDMVVSYEQGKVVLVYKGSRRELPAVDFLKEMSWTLNFPSKIDSNPLRYMDLKRGDDEGELDVEGSMEMNKITYTLKGTVKKK